MADKTTSDSLPSLHEHLEATYRRAPSLATLKRWAAAGNLQRCEVHRLTRRASRSKDAKEGTRARGKTRYDRQRAIEMIGTFWELTPIHQPSIEPQAEPRPAAPRADHSFAGGHPVDIAPLLVLVANLETQVQDLRSAVAAVNQSISQLNGVRTTLMTKYDATNSHQSELIELLRNKAKEAENNSSLARDVQALRIAVSNLQGAVTQGR